MENLKTIINGEPATAMFSAAEMTRRLDGLRAYMAEAGIDAALLTSYHNVNYFSGFLYCSFGRPYGLVVTPNDATTVSANVDFARVALACGYRRAAACDSIEGLARALSESLAGPGPALVHLRIAPGSIAKLGRPTISPPEVARRFRAFLAGA